VLLEDDKNDESAVDELSARLLAGDQVLSGDTPLPVRDALEDYKKVVHIDEPCHCMSGTDFPRDR